MRSAYYRADCKPGGRRDDGNRHQGSYHFAMVILSALLLPHEYSRDDAQMVGSSFLEHNPQGATAFASGTMHSAAGPGAPCVLCRQARAAIVFVLKLPIKLAEQRLER